MNGNHKIREPLSGMVIFLDIKKAYDSVPSYYLIHKLLTQFGDQIPVYLIKFFRYWIMGHKKKILLNDDINIANEIR